MITIVLADDYAIVRKHVRALLEEDPSFSVIGEANGGPETIGIVERLHPDVLVLDMVMGGMNGIEVTRRLQISTPYTKIIIYSIYDNKAYVVGAIQAGAKAYILKGSDSTGLVYAIKEVITGHVYLSEALLKYSNELDQLINQNKDSGI